MTVTSIASAIVMAICWLVIGYRIGYAWGFKAGALALDATIRRRFGYPQRQQE